MSRIFEITERVASYAPKADIDLINRAYVFATHAHAGQMRLSGEHYITHPLAVADILASLGMDESSVITGLLHDTVEDTSVTLADIEQHFGGDIAQLVDGVTKIGKIHFKASDSSALQQAENFRKMILATAKDLRVLIVKLADRLHNMRTLDFMPEEKRELIGRETLQIYAPLAHRLGIHWIRQEMEDLVFAHLESDAHASILHEMQDRIEGLNQTRQRLEAIIQQALADHGVKARVQGRMKHLYSIHEKMQRKRVNFDEIFDLVAFRVIVENLTTCYQTLGVIHSLYRPVPGRFKDYIALPKPNGYQSLHTTVIGPENFRIEVQVRTENMHTYAEDGVAAHWLYKDGKGADSDQDGFKWLKQLTELLQETDNPDEFLESVRLDLFVQEVYVFSRDGDIFALPRGSMPLDFAYAVHTDVGHHCIGVRINGEIADFFTRMHNGDQIEILTSPEQTPGRQWLQYVRTPRARQSIRLWFRRQERSASIGIGQQILIEATGKPDVGQTVVKDLEFDSLDELKIALGRGEIPIPVLLDTVDKERSLPLKLTGIGRTLMHAAECCHPIPGDPVLGQFSSGEGMILHHRKCSQIKGRNRKHLLDVEWQEQPGQLFSTGIEVRSQNIRGMLARVTKSIAEASSSIEDLKLKQQGGAMTELLFLVEVEDRKHLAAVMRSIKAVEGVAHVCRRDQVGLSGKPTPRAITEALRDFFSSRKASEKKDQKEKSHE